MSRSRGAMLLLGLAALTLVKLWWCGRFQLEPDEAYYRLWSQHLDWAYYSKGPGVALAIRFATAIGGDTERGLRWLSPILAMGTTLLLYVLVRSAISQRAAIASAIALQCVPMFAAGSLLMTVDPLSVFFWVLALLCAWKGRGRDAWWLACGIACGAGFLCKYTNALVLVGIMLASLPLLRSARRVALLLAGFLPFVAPPLIWNAQRGWPTAHHLFERGGLAREGAWLRPRETLEFLVVHFGTWSPILFALVLLALPSMLRDRRDGARFLLVASAPVLVMYCVLALHEAGEANWTAPGVLGLLPLASDRWLARWHERRVRWACVGGLAIGAILGLVISNTNLLRDVGLALPAKPDPSTRLRGWIETARAVEELAPANRPVIANHYGLASELNAYGRFEPPVTTPRGEHPKNQFWFWPDFAPRTSETFTFVTDRPKRPEEDWPALACEAIGERAIDGEGGTLRTIRAWSCVSR